MNETLYIGRRGYSELLEELLAATRALAQPVDCVIGIRRSGLFPAVYLSHQLKLPMFVDTEVRGLPVERLRHPLIVDTVIWTGRSVRRTLRRIKQAGGCKASVLGAYGRVWPPPNFAEYAQMIVEAVILRESESVPRFWYSEAPDSHLNAAAEELPCTTTETPC